MTNGRVEIEIYRAASGCRWSWDIYADKQFLCNGVKNTIGEAMDAVRNVLELLELHGLIELEEV